MIAGAKGLEGCEDSIAGKMIEEAITITMS